MDVDDDKDLAGSLLLFTEAIHEARPGATAALYAERARAFLDAGDLAAAAADAGRAAEMDPTMARAHLRRARACLGLGRLGSARAALLAGAALAPCDPRFAATARELEAHEAETEAAEKNKQRTEAADGCVVHGSGYSAAASRPPAHHRRASSCVL